METMSAKRDFKRISPVMITYVIVLACLIAGLFVPFFTCAIRESDGVAINASIMQVFPEAIIKGFGLGEDVFGTLPGYFATGATVFATSPFTDSVNIQAISVLIYGFVTFVGIIALIPMGVCTSRRAKGLIRENEEPMAVTGWAYIIEVLSLLAIALYLCCYIFTAENGYTAEKGNTVDRLVDEGILMICLFAVTWLMYVIQTIYYKSKQGSGVIKMILCLLSVIALAMTLFCSNGVTFEGLDTFADDKLHGTVGFVGGYSGFALIDAFVQNGGAFDPKVINVFALTTLAVTMFNFIVDIISCAGHARRGGKVFGIVRFALELALAIVTCIMVAAQKDDAEAKVLMGIVIYGIIIVSFIQLAISVSRMFVKDPDAVPKEAKPVPPTEHKKPVNSEIITEPDAPVAPGGFYDVAPETLPPVYTRAYEYNGDAFIMTLTPGERSEFYALFIDKIKGNFYYLPEYVIGQDNKEFFAEIFVHLGNIMGIISTQLLNKIYRRIGALD